MTTGFLPHWYQYPPPDPYWHIWALEAQRGTGATRLGAEWLVAASHNPHTRLVIIGPDHVRTKAMLEGYSGILSCLPITHAYTYSPSTRVIKFHNGSTISMFSALEPQSLRGQQFDGAWAGDVDEWSEPQGYEAFDNLMMCTRLGPQPRIYLNFHHVSHRISDRVRHMADQDRMKVRITTV